ncbi:acylphosphatase [Methanospirillum sp. J.3.6.1-F.2.7.3]|uniref:acylphosphatase n=1 Tax=Methanospirillum purgamenti TaxID=2834276 RepID=A0A8E7AZX6_9EURY|nr:acylphosphatase [Methanospirillum sp. J.3.6.1-F.2.7.3]
MRRVKIIAGGDVQAVGYREYVRKATFRKKIFGQVQNHESGEVEIIAEGEENDLKSFIENINVSEYPIDVRECNVTWHDAIGDYTKFEIIRGDKDQELFERIDVAGSLLYRVVENTTLSLEKQDQMLEKQDLMLGKQDQMLGKQDEMISLQHDTVEEIKGLRKDSESYFEKEFSEIKRKLHSIENALNEMGIKV